MEKDSAKFLNEKSSLKIIRDFEKLEEIRNFWEKVQWHPYTDIDYFLRFAKVHQGFRRPHVMLLSSNGQPSTLVVGWLQDAPISWKIGYKTVHKSHARCFLIEYGGILGDTSLSNCIVLVEAIMNCLTEGEADVAFFNFIKFDSPIYQAAIKVPTFLCREHFPKLNPHWKLSLPPSFDEFYRMRSKNTKSNIRKYANRIKKHFGENFTVRCFQKHNEVDQAMHDIEIIAAKTYQRGLGVGFSYTAEARTEWMFAAKREWLRAYVLYFNNQPCAFLTGLVYDRVFYLETLGFDRTYHYYHPGMFLFMRMIEEFCRDEKVKAIDFGLGHADYKRNYGDHIWQDAGVYIFASTLKGLRLNAISSLTTILSQMAINTLSRMKILDLIKTKWRRRLISPQG